jgi:hypothetical protein
LAWRSCAGIRQGSDANLWMRAIWLHDEHEVQKIAPSFVLVAAELDLAEVV